MEVLTLILTRRFFISGSFLGKKQAPIMAFYKALHYENPLLRYFSLSKLCLVLLLIFKEQSRVWSFKTHWKVVCLRDDEDILWFYCFSQLKSIMVSDLVSFYDHKTEHIYIWFKEQSIYTCGLKGQSIYIHMILKNRAYIYIYDLKNRAFLVEFSAQRSSLTLSFVELFSKLSDLIRREFLNLAHLFLCFLSRYLCLS